MIGSNKLSARAAEAILNSVPGAKRKFVVSDKAEEAIRDISQGTNNAGVKIKPRVKSEAVSSH